ncbi:Morphology and auto-aggregation control protein [Phaeobacter sp. CECT 5382]|uniref:LysR family transcriptional regulator n=1 Tax=Rhodobacterales TaxID=204455 RepID=UPI0006DA473D|nr:LysR family transcriptional regulator [Phaeobacter sp. CECT 5382]CUH89125.1 Morphology and auto-aggregation control protein [Phaeobacter sp. CECT 5382]
MLMKGVTLRGLEVFETLAKTGSVAQTAEVTGLSQPAVSQQLRNLEKALGADLVDHGRRPMVPTSAGRNFLARTEAVLSELRLAQSELSMMDLSHLPALSIGLIDDFDNDLTPRLVTALAESLTECRFKMITASSHDILRAIEAREIHIAVTATTGEPHEGLIEFPLVRDPFILVAPKGMIASAKTAASQLESLPFLRYAGDQLISQQIEAQLQQHQSEFENRFEIGSHLALMAMVAGRIGWAVTTPLGYMRAARFHDDIEAFPLPFGTSARTISLFASNDWADQLPRSVAQTIQGLIKRQMVDPAISRLPWLAEGFKLIESPS